MKNIFKFTLISFLILFAGQAYAEKRALVISINNYKDPKIRTLKGSVNDGKAIVNILKTHLSFTDSQIKFMKDHEATRDAILEAFDEWLIKGTRPGDKVFIYYSGHGTYFKDLDGDETDEIPPFDEALCPYDTETGPATPEKKANLIIDDEIGERLNQLNGRVIVTIFDSCHSGTGTKGEDNSETVRSLEPGLIYLDDSAGVADRGLSRGLSRGHSSSASEIYGLSEEIDAGKSYMTFLSAASPRQKAYELTFENEKHGVLTYSIIESFMKNPETVCIGDIKRIFYSIKEKYTKTTHQDPQLEGNPGLASRSLKEIFDTSWIADVAYAADTSQNSGDQSVPEPLHKPPEKLPVPEPLHKPPEKLPVPEPVKHQPPPVKPKPFVKPQKTAMLSLWANQKGKNRFNQYDKLRFYVNCSADGYLYIFDLIEKSDEMYLIFPNQWQSDNRIEKNKEILVPPAFAKGKPVSFEFRADQRGKEIIIAIVTQKRWDDMDKIIGKNNEPVKQMTSEQKMQVLELIYQKQSQNHVEYDKTDSDKWTGTSLKIEIY